MEPTSLFVVTAAQLAPLTSAVTDNLAVLLPVGLGLMAITLGISMIPKIIYRFF